METHNDMEVEATYPIRRGSIISVTVDGVMLAQEKCETNRYMTLRFRNLELK